jgi:hypothetical protein
LQSIEAEQAQRNDGQGDDNGQNNPRQQGPAEALQALAPGGRGLGRRDGFSLASHLDAATPGAAIDRLDTLSGLTGSYQTVSSRSSST